MGEGQGQGPLDFPHFLNGSGNTLRSWCPGMVAGQEEACVCRGKHWTQPSGRGRMGLC